MPRRSSTVQGCYNGNTLLPLPSTQIALSAHELQEFVRCSQDCSYFINNYVKILHVDYGIVTFKLWPFQEEMIQTFEKNRYTICRLARQTGKSTAVVCGYFLWFVLFKPDSSVAILANKESTAVALLDRFKQSFELLPEFLKQGVVKWDQKLVKFANNSRVRAESTSANAIRGDSFSIVMLDEFAFVPNNIAQDFLTSVFPVISSGQTTKMIIVSTPNGYNLFYKLWMDAVEKRSSFVPISYTWRDVPGRDDAWAAEMRKNMGSADKFEQEFNVQFQGSAGTLIAPWKLSQLHYESPIFVKNSMNVYAEPIRNTVNSNAHVYLACVDVGEGQEKDSSVIMVFDISSNPFRQVAVWRDNKTKPTQLAPIVLDIVRYYNHAYCLFEVNGEGAAVADMMNSDLGYEKLLHVYSHPKYGQQLSSGFNHRARLGLKTTEYSKRLGCTGLKSLIESDKLVISDYETLHELTTFVAQPSKSGKNRIYAADAGNHDDCVMPMVLLGWLTLQTKFEDYVGISMRQLLMDGGEKLEMDGPFLGYLGDGEREQVTGEKVAGYDVINDPAFWRDDMDNRWLF